MSPVIFFAFVGYAFEIFSFNCSRSLGEKGDKRLQPAIFSSTPYKQNLFPVVGGHGKVVNCRKFYRVFISFGMRCHMDLPVLAAWSEGIFQSRAMPACLGAELAGSSRSGGKEKDCAEDCPFALCLRDPEAWGVLHFSPKVPACELIQY